jgi:hypothetical protein
MLSMERSHLLLCGRFVSAIAISSWLRACQVHSKRNQVRLIMRAASAVSSLPTSSTRSLFDPQQVGDRIGDH